MSVQDYEEINGMGRHWDKKLDFGGDVCADRGWLVRVYRHF